MCDSFFGLFVLSWIYTRLYLFSTNILYTVYYDGWELQRRLGEEKYHGISGSGYWPIWAGFNVFLWILIVLHTYWSFLIGRMLFNILRAGHQGLSKDIRSDSEADDEPEEPKKSSISAAKQAKNSNGDARKRQSKRSRKASE